MGGSIAPEDARSEDDRGQARRATLRLPPNVETPKDSELVH